MAVKRFFFLKNGCLELRPLRYEKCCLTKYGDFPDKAFLLPMQGLQVL